MKYSLIIPVYKNEGSIDRLLASLAAIHASLGDGLELVFVVDGSPDQCATLLTNALPKMDFSAQLILHSRNFGSFAAIRTGMAAARGRFFAVMAADLQEPPDLVIRFFHMLEADECDVVMGTRSSRDDPFISRAASTMFWKLYRRFVISEMPEGGVDVFGCNAVFRESLLQLEEARSSLVALLFWLGFRRKTVEYARLKRKEGHSAWTFAKKIDYMLDSIFAFTDLPIRLLLRVGGTGIVFSFFFGLLVLSDRFFGASIVPGYAANTLLMLFIGSLNLFSLGVVGSYTWRSYENGKNRPIAVVLRIHNNDISMQNHYDT